ncbi:MAG: glucosylglycerol-phosphate synthase [Rhodospirillales bacterium]
MSSDLVIVYHRQPYEEVEVDGRVERRENKSPNGIVPTLKSFFGRARGGSWVAWKLADDPANPDFEKVITIEDSFGTYRVSRLALTPEQVTSFYHVTSKEAMWPILHSFKERYNYDPVDWPIYREVNWAFAEAAAAEADDDGVVWVHDYNLWLVPQYLRQIKPSLRIAFFHHTPFPAADMFNVMSWRKEIVESLLCCDVVGFHVPRYAANFAAVAKSLCNVKVTHEKNVRRDFSRHGMALSEVRRPTVLDYQGRDVHLSVAPVGVDVDYITQLARSAETAKQVKAIRKELGETDLILSVSRTDYTKGGLEMLETYERLFERRPDLIGKVRLMLVSVSANRNMTAYEEVQSQIEETVGRINGRFGSFEWQPVALISSPVPFPELIAYYQAAKVCWITPLADGLNLVASEFVASRTDLDGCLVLSEFAGVAVILDEAVLTNPFSHRAMDHAIDQGLAMEKPERRSRMKALRDKVKRYDIKAWGQAQNRDFEAVRHGQPPAHETEPPSDADAAA